MTFDPTVAPTVTEPVVKAIEGPPDPGLQLGALVADIPAVAPGVPMIEIDAISKWYGDFQVLTDCTTKVSRGEVVVVCGPSGSGKSTLIKCVNALEPIQKGQITVAGTKVVDKATDLPKLRAKVGMVFQHFALFPHLSITDNLTIAQSSAAPRRMRRDADWACSIASVSPRRPRNILDSSRAVSSSAWRSPALSP